MRIALISTPRSGNTWLRRLISNLYDIDSIAEHNPEDVNWEALPERCILQIHWEDSSEFSKKLEDFGFKTITIKRHPLDTLLSILQFCSHEPMTKRWLEGASGNESSIINATPASEAFAAYATSERAKKLLSISHTWSKKEDCVTIKFEDLVENPKSELRKISDRFGAFNKSPDTALEETSIAKQRSTSKNNHFWQGKPNLWQSLITRKLTEEIFKTHRQLFYNLGYKIETDTKKLPNPIEADNNWLELIGSPKQPSNLISYAQNFEDVMLWRALSKVKDGFYIDIGAHDPVVDSVSLLFHERGWRGIHIDASISCANALREQRIGDTVINAAVAEQEGIIEFFSFKQADKELGISSCDIQAVESSCKAGYTAIKETVPTITLDGVFNQLNNRQVHWLKIDVEGFEEKVINGWKSATIRPWIIVIESTLPGTQTKSHSKWEPVLIDKGYKFAHFDGLNRFYISNKQLDLLSHFEHPPCVFDQFVLNGTATNTFSEHTKKLLRESTQERDVILCKLKEQKNYSIEAQEEIKALNKTISEDRLKIVQFQKIIEVSKLKNTQLIDQHHAIIHEYENEKKSLLNTILEEKIRSEQHKAIELQLHIEILRIKKLIYSAPARKHLYRAIKVSTGDSHYRQNLSKTHSLKKYTNLKVAWHTHVYRGFRALAEKGEKPWHTHFYRAALALFRHSKYSKTQLSTPQKTAILEAPKCEKLVRPTTEGHSITDAHLIDISGTEAIQLESYKNHIRTSKEIFTR